MNKIEEIIGAGGNGQKLAASAVHGKQQFGATLGSRAAGMLPWLMIAGLLYAGLFIHPTPKGGAVIPPTIERRDLLFGVSVTDTGNVWIAGNFGKIVKSHDGGSSWAKQESGLDAHLQDIDSWDDHNAIAVGNSATLLRTQDGGETWAKIEVPHSEVADKLVRVHTYKGVSAWAVGEYGTILLSTDQGVSWKQMRPPEDVNIDDIDASNPNNIWAAGESGKLFHSVDDGATWVTVQSEATSSLMALEFRDASHALAVGLDGTILWTDNAGAAWHRVADSMTQNTQHLFAVQWDPLNEEWIAVGSKGVWLRINPEHSQFKTGKLSTSDLSAHTKIGVIDKDHLLIAGDSPGIWDKSTWTSLIGR
jgi:photosystem II stability/assembly factor-like uncharacterized protein